MRWRCSVHFRALPVRKKYTLCVIKAANDLDRLRIRLPASQTRQRKPPISWHVRLQRRLQILWKFFLPEARVVNLFAILRVFLVGLGNWSEFFVCFIELRDFKRKLNICWGKQELARTCSVYMSMLPASRVSSIFLDQSGRGRDSASAFDISYWACSKLKCNRASPSLTLRTKFENWHHCSREVRFTWLPRRFAVPGWERYERIVATKKIKCWPWLRLSKFRNFDAFLKLVESRIQGFFKHFERKRGIVVPMFLFLKNKVSWAQNQSAIWTIHHAQ